MLLCKRGVSLLSLHERSSGGRRRPVCPCAGASLGRSALCADFPAMLVSPALRQNSRRSLRSLCSNSCRKSVHEARVSFGTRAGRAPCASRRPRGAPAQGHTGLRRDTGRLIGRCLRVDQPQRVSAAGGIRQGLMPWRSMLRIDCAAVLTQGVASQNSLRAPSVRFVQTAATSQFTRHVCPSAHVHAPCAALLAAAEIARHGKRLPR